MQKEISINKRIFWDVDPAELDVYAHSAFIVARVLNRGSIEDIKQVLNFYTTSELTKAVKENRLLNEKSLHFIAQYLNLEVTDFPCYEQIRLNPYLSAH